MSIETIKWVADAILYSIVGFKLGGWIRTASVWTFNRTVKLLFGSR